MNSATEATEQGVTIPQKTPVERLYAFIKQMAKVHLPPEFILNKAYDFALSLPEVHTKLFESERHEAAMALVIEMLQTKHEDTNEDAEKSGRSDVAPV
jgi:hypothetical protein